MLEEFKPQIEQELRKILLPSPSPNSLDLMYCYHMGFCDRNGQPSNPKGKYLRPALCLALCSGLRGDPVEALPAAASLEILHRTTLIFDDIQDGGMERNGQPTIWKVWGMDQAINAGLALSCHSRLALQRMNLPAVTVLHVHSLLEGAAIALCQGQYQDLSFTDGRQVQIPDYLEMVRGKTAALFGVACEIGAICSPAGVESHTHGREFGIDLGVAFQIHDDYLGIWGDEAVVGKTVNDLTEKKRSLPVVMGLEKDPEQMGAWLSDMPQDTNKIRSWMESCGIPDQVLALEKYYALQARISLDRLNLSQKWKEEIEKLILVDLG